MATFQEIESGRQVVSLPTKTDASTAVVLSVVMPVFNEAATIERVIVKVQESEIEHELIIVDDGSNDGTAELLQQFAATDRIQILRHETNYGKGAALKLGFAQAHGQIVIVQDADLEYDPEDYRLLIEPIIAGEADVVFGSRFLATPDVSMPRRTYWANRIITSLFNRITGQHLTDVETCYKAFRREILLEIAPSLVERRFGIEIELVARVDRLPGVRIVERPIHYRARTRHEGKKISWRDGIRALWCICRYR